MNLGPLFESFISFILRRRLGCALALIVFSLVHLFGLRYLSVDLRPEAFVSETEPAFQAREAYEARWGSTSNGITLLLSTTEDTFLTPNGQAHLKDVQAALKHLPHIKSVRGFLDEPFIWRDAEGTIHQQTRALYLESMRTPPIPHGTPQAPLGASAVYDSSFMAADGSSSLLMIQLKGIRTPIEELPGIIQSMEEKLSSILQDKGLSVDFMGVAALRSYFYTQTISEQRLFLTLSLASMLLVLFLFYGSALCVCLFGICALISLLFFSGAMGFLNVPIGLINQILFSLIPAFALANAIHIFNQLQLQLHRQESAPNQSEWHASIAQAMGLVLPVCLGTLATTAFAFLSLVFTDVAPIRQFGLLAALGMLYVFFSLGFAFPLLLSSGLVRAGLWNRHMAHRKKATDAIQTPSFKGGALMGICNRLGRPKEALGLCVLLVGAAVFSLYYVKLDNELASLLPQNGKMTQAMQKVDRSLGGSVRLAVEVHPFTLKGATPADLQRLHGFAADLSRLPLVRSVFSGHTFFQDMHTLLLQEQSLPKTSAQIQQYGFLLGDAATDLFFQGPYSRLLIGVEDAGGRAMLDTIKAIQRLGEQHFGPSTSIQVHGPIADAFGRLANLVQELLRGFFLACFVVLGLMGLILRELKLVLLSVIPNLFPMLCALLCLSFFDWPLDVGPAVLCTVAFGIAVDDTLHMLANYQRARQKRVPKEAVGQILSQTGYAILISSCVIGIGFLVQGISSFESIHRIGVLGGIIMLGALIGDLLILPVLLLATSKERKSQG